MQKAPCPYNTRLQKGGALLDDMRLLVRQWSEVPAGPQGDAVVVENLLGKETRSRAFDIYRRVFRPRFLEGDPPSAWKLLQLLEDRELSLEIVRPVYYWVTARRERILYDFVIDELAPRSRSHDRIVRTEEVASWITERFAQYKRTLSSVVTSKLARGVLSTLRDFGILEGAVKKRIAPAYLPIEAFAYLSFALHAQGTSGQALVGHKDWALFLLQDSIVENQFLEADRRDLLTYQAAGRIVRVDFPAHSFEEMADVVARRSY